MPSRKDSTSRRLFNLFQHATWQHAEQIAEQRLSDMLARIGGRIDFADDIAHAAFSREALMLEESSERDRPVFAAFKAAGLSPDNPMHWRYLVFMFSEAHFGKAETKPKMWHSFALSEVRADYLTIKGENPGTNQSEICQLLRRDRRFKHKYHKYNPDAFRRLLRHANSPKYNILLRHPEMNDPALQLLRDHHEQSGLQWSSESEMDYRAAVKRLSALSLFKKA
jgi:hypothetical protein